MKKTILLIVLYITILMNGYTQNSSEVETKMNEILKKYESVKGVDCMTVTRGSGLGLIKTMLNQEFGKNFMKGVTSITIINYTDASPEVCLALHKELDSFLSLLEEFKDKDEKPTDEQEYTRSFARPIDENTISDFVIAMEDKETKMIIYMAGKIKVE